MTRVFTAQGPVWAALADVVQRPISDLHDERRHWPKVQPVAESKQSDVEQHHIDHISSADWMKAVDLNLKASDVIKAVVAQNSQNVSLPEFEKMNKDSLQNMIKYISTLRAEGAIEDDVFSKLVSHACAIFVENEVTERVRRALAHSLPMIRVTFSGKKEW